MRKLFQNQMFRKLDDYKTYFATKGGDFYYSIIGSGAVHSNKKIYYAPIYYDKIVEFDPTYQTYKKVGSSLGTNTPKYRACCFHPIGSVYFCPQEAIKILKYTPSTDISVDTSIDVTAYAGNTGNPKYGDIIYHPITDRLYLIPLMNNRILEYNPYADTAVEVGSTYTGSNKYSSAVVVDNYIYCSPSYATKIMRYNVVTGISELVGQDMPSGYAPFTSIIHINGSLYMTNVRNNNILIHNISTGINSIATNTLGISGVSSASAYKNKIYFISTTQFIEFDPATLTFKYVGTTLPSNYYYLGAVTVDNVIYVTPRDSYNILALRINNK